MNSESREKIVDFDQYCDPAKCKHYPTIEGEEPCEECLSNPTNLDSHKPVKYEPIE